MSKMVLKIFDRGTMDEGGRPTAPKIDRDLLDANFIIALTNNIKIVFLICCSLWVQKLLMEIFIFIVNSK